MPGMASGRNDVVAHRRVRRWGIGIVVFFGLWLGSAVAGAALQNQFLVAVDAAAERGGWERESVYMLEGSYRALPFVFLTHVEVTALTPDGERRAEIEVINVPLLGYHHVRRFRAGG